MLAWRTASGEYRLKPSRRELLSPAEIALLVLAAHLHDLGMGLSDAERKARLASDSDLWDRIEDQSSYMRAIDALVVLSTRADIDQAAKAEAAFQVQQAQEALLCADSRERHATRARYEELIASFEKMNRCDPVRILDVHSLLSFGNDSFEDKLIEICVSHNEGAQNLLESDPSNPDQLRFPTEYAVGSSVADTRFVAATLRLADVLDFDRERTPEVLFHYLLPQSEDPNENVSLREWSKHLAISNWEIVNGQVIFRGRSSTALTHHTIVEFCRVIEDEIARTRTVFADVDAWPFTLEPHVVAQIDAAGYRYIPYRFSVDEERVYELFMGSKIYHDPLDAVRELIQNAVDACRLRDALLLSYDPSVTPSNRDRIIVRYEEPTGKRPNPILNVIDTGAGMDRCVIENYLLRVGRSYYKSSEFLKIRAELRKINNDFAPVSEFGIGFLSSFMLGDRIVVETAAAPPFRRDTARRVLKIDGVGRLIEVSEDPNTRVPRFHGTRVSITLARAGKRYEPPQWDQLERYLRAICANLAYPVKLQHIENGTVTEEVIAPSGLRVSIPDHLIDAAVHIPVEGVSGLRGEIVLYREQAGKRAEAALAAKSLIRTEDTYGWAMRGAVSYGGRAGTLIRGGFAIGPVPGLPSYTSTQAADARITVETEDNRAKLLPPTDLSRSRLVDTSYVHNAVFRIWFEHVLRNINEYEEHPLGNVELDAIVLRYHSWIKAYDAFTIYRAAKMFWKCVFSDPLKFEKDIAEWEAGDGGSLYLGRWRHFFHRQLFDLFMPRVTTLVMGTEGTYYLKPPRAGWRDKLVGWNTYIGANLSWGAFATYTSAIQDQLYDEYTESESLNIRYKDRFEGFSESEVKSLIKVFQITLHARRTSRQAHLSVAQAELLRRTINVAGDLTISYLTERYKVQDLG